MHLFLQANNILSRVFLKLENLQPSASFKSRGIGNLLLSAVKAQRSSSDDRPPHFHASSGGNAGLACVTAAVTLGYRSTVCVPVSTDDAMVARLRTAGASDVIVYGSTWIDADRFLREEMMPKAEEMGQKAIYVPPFDHADIWTGAATMIPEIRRQMPGGERPDAIVCSVGGGGLFAGIMQGLRDVEWDQSVRVLAVETFGAESLAQSVRQDRLVTLPGITSVAKSLGAVRVAERAFQDARKANVSTVVIEDAEACASSWRFADDERILVEPACGASVALAYDGRLKKYLKGFSSESKVVIVVCGGSRINLKMMEEYRLQFGDRARELGLERCVDVPSSHTS